MSKQQASTTLGACAPEAALKAHFSKCPDIEQLAMLAIRVTAGDNAAADALYHSLIRGVRLLARRRAGAVNVDDVVQDVFAALFDALRRGKLRNPRAIIAYTWQTVHNVCCEYVRGIARDRLSVNSDDVSLISQTTTDTSHSMRERRARVSAALARLDQRDRDILTRFYLDEQSPAEIMKAMDLTVQQYRNLKHSATVRLTRFVKIAALPRPAMLKTSQNKTNLC